MSKLYYRIPIHEEYYENQETQNLFLPRKTFRYNLPHEKTIANWFSKEWNNAHMEQYFDDILKDKVESCIMKPMIKQEKDKRYLFGNVTITFVPGFRLNSTKREACWNQLDAQMTDGFGESYDRCPIPGAPAGFSLQL